MKSSARNPLLHWTGKESAVVAAREVPYRPLVEAPDLSYGDPGTENLLIQGDNLDALKSLLPSFAGRVKCIFIDPPYNTRSAFEHYDDNREHSIWLSMMYPRLELLRELMAEDGSIWVTIDDNEEHYLKVIMDEVFGRANYVASAVWQKVLSVKNSARHFSVDHDYILVYAKQSDSWFPNRVPGSAKQRDAYKNPDQDARGPWQSVSLSARNPYSKGLYSVRTPSGRVIDGPPPGRYWAIAEEALSELDADGRVWWGKSNDGVPRRKVFLSEQGELRKIPQTLWMFEDVGHTQDAKKEALALNSDSVFPTPKPERLLCRVLEIATTRGDIVLDSFAGSATTAAVAHKMGRRHIGIEMGDHAVTHCVPRLRKVIEGEQGGISKSVGWQGGGGFRFCRLGEPVFDGHEIKRENSALSALFEISSTD